MNFKSLLVFSTFVILCVSTHAQQQFIDKRTPKSPVKLDKQDRIDMAIAQEYEMTFDPEMEIIPRYKLEEARKVAELKREFAVENGQSGILGILWDERGPNNVGGRTRAILVDAADNTGNTVIVGSVAGGLWRSTAANSVNPNWYKIDDFLENLAVSAIVQDPQNSDIIYFGTGEGYYNIDAVQGNGLYKSTNGGLTWVHLAATNNDLFHYTQSMKIAPNGDLYVATSKGGLQKSSDGGLSFQKVLGASNWASNNTITDVEIASNGYIFAAIGIYTSDGIYMSPDDGLSWMKLTNGLPDIDNGRTELAVAPGNANYIYAMVNHIETNECLGMYRSTNGGNNWVEIDNPIMYGNQNFLRKQGWYNMAIAVDPNNESRLFIGGIDVFVSDNAGLSFEQVTQWYGAQSMDDVHADQHNITFAPNSSSIVYIGNDGGIYRSENADAQDVDFSAINQGYNVTQFYSADFHPQAGSPYIAAGAQDNGTQLFSQSGMNATTELTGGDGGITHFDKANGNLIITTYVYNNFRVSTDMGNDFTYRSFGNSGRFINPNDYDDTKKIIYSGHNTGNYLRWNNPAEKGDSIDIVSVTALQNEMISSVLVAPNTENTIYVGTGNGKLVKIDQANEGVVKTGEVIHDGTGYLSSIAIVDGNENHMLVTHSNYGVTSIYETTDAGANWQAVEGDLPDFPVRWVVFNPNNENQALIATELGVWSTNDLDGNATVWEPSNGGLANVRTDMIKFRESDNMILAATHGRGVFTSDFFANSVVNFSVDSLEKFEYADLKSTDGCARDYSVISIPVSLSAAPDEGGYVGLSVQESDAVEGDDFDIVYDSLFLDASNMSVDFELHIYDDAMMEPDEYIKLELTSQTLDLGVAKEIYIALEDNDESPFNLPPMVERTVGTGSNEEKNTPFKSYYEDERSQVIVTAQELLDAGIIAGEIESLALNVIEKNSSVPYSGFKIKLGVISTDAFAVQGPQFEDVATTVHFDQDYNTNVGWNEFSFSSPFTWDGVSNILIEFCYDNANFSADDVVAASQTDVFSSQYKFIDGSVGCNISLTPTVKMQRANLRFKQSATVMSAHDVAIKHSVTKYPGMNNFYTDNHDIILTVEHNTADVSSCFASSIDQAGHSTETKSWLLDSRVSQKQFYTEGQGDFEGSLNLYFSAAEVAEWGDINNVNILRTNDRISTHSGNDFEIIPNVNILVTEIHEDLFAFSFYTTELGGFALTDYFPTTVPVTLVSFEALRNGENNLLEWRVEDEINIDHYIVERSFDGYYFEELGAVSATVSDKIANNYYFEDRDLYYSNKNYYYRLKVLEFDGTSKYSDIVAVFVKEESVAHIDAYPNPFAEGVTIELSADGISIASIRILDIRGQVVAEQTGTDLGNQANMDMSKLLPGVYVVELVDDNAKNYLKTIIKR